jgi:hypothetical protein
LSFPYWSWKAEVVALKESTRLLGKTWGERITASVGFALLLMLALIPVAVAFGVALAVIRTPPKGGVILLGAYVSIVFVILRGLNAAFTTALYMYVKAGLSRADSADSLVQEILGRWH